MKSLLRLSIDDNDKYILEYRVRYGLSKGQVVRYSFTKFSSMLEMLLSYLFNLHI